ncbi:MAG: efflux RND transporter periplasmic adaptor subunit [Ignavibacteriota bacterium]
MKKILTVVIAVILIIGITGILLMNKSKREEKLKKVEIQTTVPVFTAKVTEEKVTDTLSLVGTTAPFNEVVVSAETAGRVIGLYFDVGSNVGKGKMLIKLDDEVKRATLENAEANFEKAKKDYERFERLLETKSITEVQYESAKLTYKQTESALKIAQRQLKDSKIICPLSGVVISKSVELGTYLNTGNPVATVVNIDRLKVKVYVPELEAFKLKEGDAVELTTEVYPGTVFNGKITTINAKADDAHSYLVEITVNNNKSYPLRAGLFARVSFKTLETISAIVIPRAALIGSIKEAKVFVVENNVARLRKIVVGSEFGNRMEVVEGLSVGETVVVNGQVNLRDSVAVTITQ